MNLGLNEKELELIRRVLARHEEIESVRIFGSRAKGTFKPYSDIDLALWGNLSPLETEAVAAELEELPLPYKFELTPFQSITFLPLREHIERVGIQIFPITANSKPKTS